MSRMEFYKGLIGWLETLKAERQTKEDPYINEIERQAGITSIDEILNTLRNTTATENRFPWETGR